ncbi:hypothetical protein ACFVTP_33030 [Streptomyces celluloflavus]|uniref:hypothetical protein n=1 Tax=Streptomyces celluloflavus TaxID=58344 RepID=UPI0036D9149E
MISLPLFFLAGAGTYAAWRMDSRAFLLICALVCGYALATSPLASAIDAFGSGIGHAVQSAGNAK